MAGAQRTCCTIASSGGTTATQGRTRPRRAPWDEEELVAITSGLSRRSGSTCAAAPVAVSVEPVRIYTDDAHAHRLLGLGEITAVEGVAGQVGQAGIVGGMAPHGLRGRLVGRGIRRRWPSRVAVAAGDQAVGSPPAPSGERCVPMRAGWLHKPWRGRQERGTAAVARLSGRAFRTIVVDARPAGLCV